MKALLFNLHDIVVLLTVGVCWILGIAYLARARSRELMHKVYGIFFIVNGFVAVNTLVYWGEGVRECVLELFPLVFMLLSPFSLLLGPILYWLLRLGSKARFTLTWLHIVHLLPAVLAPVYLYAVCFRFDVETQRDLFLNQGLYEQPYTFYSYFVSFEKLLPFVYGAVCIGMLALRLKNGESRAQENPQLKNLRTIVVSFTVLWAWVFVTHVLGYYYPGTYTDYLGISGNYLYLCLAVYLMYQLLLRSENVDPSSKSKFDKQRLNPEHVERVLVAMSEKQLFLNPQITLERFADAVQLSAREVSSVINRKFGQNFQEYVNSHRVEVAKQKLLDPAANSETITEIAQASGFNSKATFNRFFKKIVSMTPSAYRRNHQA